MAFWGGRFTKKTDFLFKKFNDSLSFDYRLVNFDIYASIMWSKMLLEVKVLSKYEQNKIAQSLKDIKKDIKKKKISIFPSLEEDIHSWIESELIKRVGSKIGKKIHTGRSRNDQVATDLRLWCRKKIDELKNSIFFLKKRFLILAEKHRNTIIPGYTHLQRAQPITFSYWCLAYIEMLARDEKRLEDILKRVNISPLGSGALSGTTWNIDRKKLASLMGFSSCSRNALDSVSDRDYVVEILSIASIGMMHLSRFSEDLIFYNTGEANFIELSDSITSGSSLMPQKKNPDLLELIRGKFGHVQGNLVGMLSTLKSLPLSYNKDLQEDKIYLFNALEIWESSLKISCLILKNICINVLNCEKAAKKGYSNATELADYLVKKGISFREAHEISGKIVLQAIKKDCYLEDLKLSTFKKFSSLISSDVFHCLKLNYSLNSKNAIGGVGDKQVGLEIKRVKQELNAVAKK